ncbi:unnamed protein product [Brassica oleracea var. botrytis]|uniref:Uncharacterized protein n=2 Tax=Brassica TaxID=3705 RepID=A0ABQ7ZZJ5_BRANA|nr:uncharacterized protein At3g27210 [Brassica napus]KAH0885680.1 hypothetical protein HID58_061776 [Brassica napus]VDD11878.1 unnamed protein product [Brassica oleracea]
METLTMAIPESLMKDNFSIPVDNSPKKAEENGYVQDKPSFTSSSTKNTSESPVKENLTPSATPTTAPSEISPSVTQMKYRWSFSSSKRSFGSSKDEAFFDTNQWLQSDSEDDFFSVKGEFTPSRGNTPKCSFSDKHPRFHNPLFEEEKPRAASFSYAPAPRRKKLAELFRESVREQREVIFEESLESQSEESKKSSGDNSGELDVIEDSEKDKSMNNHHRCLPRLSALKGNLMEKRKKKKKKIQMT